MRAVLIFLSSLIALLSIHCSAQSVAADSSFVNPQRCAFQIEMPKSCVSGILITKNTDEGIIGSMINEFGVSAIDFAYDFTKDKLTLVNVISFLNKWHVKRVLKNDLKLCIYALYNKPYDLKKNYKVIRTPDRISILNKKRNLKYTFSPLTLTHTEDETQE